jgi:hypothetical protein
VIGLHRDHVGAQPPRLAYQSAGLDAEALGRMAGGDSDGGSAGTWTTMIGLPRRAGFSCCSHDAKKALRSRNSHWTTFRSLTCSSFVPYARAPEMTSPTVPPRYAFRLEDLRVFYLVRASLPCLRAQGDHPKRGAAA